MNKSVILAGCGNMGFAMLKGWIDGGVLESGHVSVVEPNEALRVRAHGLGVRAIASVAELNPAHVPTLVVIAVKPQSMASVWPSAARLSCRLLRAYP